MSAPRKRDNLINHAPSRIVCSGCNTPHDMDCYSWCKYKHSTEPRREIFTPYFPAGEYMGCVGCGKPTGEECRGRGLYGPVDWCKYYPHFNPSGKRPEVLLERETGILDGYELHHRAHSHTQHRRIYPDGRRGKWKSSDICRPLDGFVAP